MALAGTLEIQMLANLARLQKDMTQAKGIVTSSMKSVESAVKSAQSALGALGLGLSVGAIVAYGKSIIDLADNMNDLSQRVGIGIKDLAGYTLAANQSGASIESVAKGVKGLSVYMTEHSDKLRKAGITATTANGAMTQLADLFAAMPDGVQKTALAVQLFGKAGMDMIPMLNMGSAGLQAAQEKAKAYGDKLAELAPKADEFNDLMSELALQSKVAGLNITGYLLPSLIGMASWMNDLASGGDRAKTALEFLSDKSPLFKGIVEFNKMMNGGEGRAVGYTGPRNALGLPASPSGKPAGLTAAEEESLGEKNLAGMRASGLLDGSSKSGKTPLESMLEAQKKRIAELNSLAGDEQMVSVDSVARTYAKAEAEKFLAEAMESVNKAMEDRAQKLGDDVVAAERALEIYGLTKSQIEALTIARLEENLAIEQARDADEATLAYYEKEIDARKRIRTAMAGVEAKETAKKAAEDTAAEWKRLTDDVERSLTDALVRGFEGGKDGGKNFIEAIENMLKTAAFKMVIQAVVSPAMGAMGSVLGMSGAGGAGGISNLLSAGSSANSFLGGNSAYTAFAMSEAGTSLGLSTAYIDALGIGEAAGGTALSGLGAALPWVGGALAVGSMLGLFDGGGDDPHNNPQASGFHFALSKAGATGAAGLGSPSSFQAGPTSGAGWWGDNMALSAEQVAAINQQTAAAFAQGQLLALSLGMDPSAADKAMVISTLHGTAGNGAIAGYFASIDQAFAALADAIAYQIVPNLNEFQQAGESLAQTAARLSQEFALTNQAAAMMGKDITSLTLKARDQLITMLGGVSGATSAIGGYYQAFHSESERTADARGSISSTLRAIGISNTPTTRAQFRALVEAQDLMTESGRTMYATLLSVSDAFAGITKSAEDMAAALSTDLFRTRQDYLYALVTGTMPAYANGGDHPGGWAMVGENGPELRNMGPSHIYSNADSKSLLDTSGLLAEVAALRTDVRTIGATLANTAKRTTKTIERWDADGLPAERVLV